MEKKPYASYAARRVFCQRRERYFFFKSALCLAIVFLLIVSVFFVKSAGETVLPGQVVFNEVYPMLDASGEDSVLDTSVIDPILILSQEMPVIYGVDVDEVSFDGAPEGSIGKAEVDFDVLPEDVKLDILRFTSDTPKDFYVGAQGPQILIYHTHTQEAYRQIPGEEYVETGSWRTADEEQSVVAVGEALKKELEAYGYIVMHDTTNHEPPKLATSYSRSVQTMLQYQRQYPTLRVFIDLHRDAYGDIEAGSKDYVTVGGDECARIMFVVGTGGKIRG